MARYSSTLHSYFVFFSELSESVVGGEDEPGKYNSAMGGFINDIDTFDSLEFGISKREAEFMDPSLRVTLEVTHQVRFLDCRLNELNFHVIF